jgi:hypothetical protein
MIMDMVIVMAVKGTPTAMAMGKNTPMATKQSRRHIMRAAV